MQAGGVAHGQVDVGREIGQHFRGCGRLRSPACKCVDDVVGIARRGKAPGDRVVGKDAGKVRQDADVFVRLGGNGNHKVHDLTAVPFDAVGDLQHGDARAEDQVAILGESMGDRNAVAEKGVGHLFPTHHAVDVAGQHILAFDQQGAGFPDGLSLVGHPGMKLYVAAL